MKLTITIGLLLIGHLTFGQDRIQKIDSLLHSLYSQEKINGNVLIAEKGKVIYSRSFGLANETTKEKLNENSIFNLASVSKQFTAMAIMILKEKGKLNLDDDIKKYLPELSFYKGVTIRNLLNHTGGLPDYMQLMDSLFDKSKIATNKDIITIFSKHQPKIVFEPNTKWEYSNTGYALLASIIEKASGLTYADYLNKAIFQPLKMKNTFVYTARLTPRHISNLATGYLPDSLNKYVIPDSINETKFVFYYDGIVGQGRVHSTTLDLLKWDRALYTNKLLSKEGIKEIFEVATLEDKSKTKYGFGWGIEDNPDFGKITNHSGGWPGYVTFIDRHITNDKTIIILQNHSNVSIPSKAIRSILYNKPLPVQKIRKEISITTEELQKFVGTYEVEKDFEIKISVDKDLLFSQLTGQNVFPIFAESDMLFFYKVVDAQIQFEKNENGEISHLFLLQDGKKTEAKRTK
ncbi:serine hydrolase [Flavobacterium amniphilum]|uniref:serine hydrolase n=1 Tax=Flavobacterium amniphilum TaxID=1834035 RepID=UPI00202A5E47|nr:serine hydrolase [Flavobacterium amniphilum]MCL9805471.1 serine hydrolase [Flavobacterium amniphilum]